jgi:SAM-dependent methyltransferase
MNRCKICENETGNQTYLGREMQFGTREEFEYVKCNNCGCLQIKEIPTDLEKYYPPQYTAYTRVPVTIDPPYKALLKHQKAKYCLGNQLNLFGFVLSKIYGCDLTGKLRRAKVHFNDKILDVGTGNGRRLVTLRREGFSNLTGIDPYIKTDISYDNGVKVIKMDILNVKEMYDFVMMNHSFEHMPNPFEVLKQIYRILKPGKIVMIRIPVVDSYSWYKYKENWVGFDPPRHLFIYNKKSIKTLAEKCGFELMDILFDGSEWQFWASEQYMQDIPMRSENSYLENPEKSMFTQSQIKKFRKHAQELNKRGEGDTACFYLRKTDA